MKSQFATVLGLLLMFQASPAAAQYYGWGAHAPVGTPPTTAPLNYAAYYRAPAAVPYYAAPGYAAAGYAAPYSAAPVQSVQQTAYYAPSYPANVAYPAAQAAWSSPYVAPGYTAYRPLTSDLQTTAYASPTYGAANYTTPGYFRPGYARTPVTMYRPVLVMDPVTGGTHTVLQPCQAYEWQARRPGTLFPWLHSQKSQPQTVNYAPANCAGGYCGYGQGYVGCGPIQQTTQPYYVPNGYAAPGYGTSGVPAGGAAPGTTYPSATPWTPVPNGGVIPPPSSFNPNAYVPQPSGNPINVPPAGTPPANIQPSLNPSEFNGGTNRREYPPNTDPYSSYSPNVSPRTPPTTEWRRVEPPASSTRENPADRAPSLLDPANETPPRPQASIRRETNISPIPDPEFQRGENHPTKTRTAPGLLPSKDRTASAGGVRLASHEQTVSESKPIAAPRSAVIGDDAWRSPHEIAK